MRVADIIGHERGQLMGGCKDGMNLCIFCNGPLAWGNCESGDECYPDMDNAENKIVYYYTCQNCSADYEIVVDIDLANQAEYISRDERKG